MGDEPYSPTPASVDLVFKLAESGLCDRSVAAQLGIDKDTLLEHHGAEFERGQWLFLGKVEKALYESALEKGSVDAQIFILQTRGGFCRTLYVKHSGFAIG